jgi:hypothetical protein
VRVNAVLLNTDDEPLGETLVVVLTSVVAEAGREVAIQESEETAVRLAEEFVELLSRIGKPPEAP